MREYIRVYCCGDCIQYDMKKHRCKLGATDKGTGQESFYRDCPLGIRQEKMAHWIIDASNRFESDGYPIDRVVCSNCGANIGGAVRYCHKCGALMIGQPEFPNPHYPPKEWQDLYFKEWREEFSDAIAQSGKEDDT